MSILLNSYLRNIFRATIPLFILIFLSYNILPTYIIDSEEQLTELTENGEDDSEEEREDREETNIESLFIEGIFEKKNNSITSERTHDAVESLLSRSGDVFSPPPEYS